MGRRSVGSGKKVKLSVNTSGIDDGEAAEIQIFKAKDNSSLDTLSSKVKNKVISADWTAMGPDPEGDEQSWEVYYKAKCKDLETKAEKLTVYCDWVEVTSVDEDDASLPDACFRLSAGTEVRDRNTGSSGVRKEEFLPPGEVTVEWLEPFRLVEWVDEKGPKRKAKLKKVLPARLVWPEKGEHTQWVNLPEDEAKPEQGHKIKVKVALKGGKQGSKVYAKLTPSDDNSKRNDPQPGFVNGITADWCPDGGVEGEMQGDDGTCGCEAELELELGKAGGDMFVLSVGGSEDCNDESVTITTWRRLHYQITRGPKTKLPATRAMESALAEVFIRYERYGEVVVPEADMPTGSLMSFADLQLPGAGKALIIGSHNIDTFKAKFSDDHTPIGAHVMLCDASYDAAGADGEQRIEVLATRPEFWVALQNAEDFDVFPTSLQDGLTSVRPGSRWESQAPDGPTQGRSGDVTPSMVVFGGEIAPDGVRMVLPPEAAEVIEYGHKVKVTLKLHVAKGPFLGEACQKHQLVVVAKDPAVTNALLVHELGHAIKQALADPAPGLNTNDHGRAYTEHGHTGHHCGFGLSDEDWRKPEYDGLDGHCVMFGGYHREKPPPNGGRFCEKCVPFVRAEDCEDVDSNSGKATQHSDVHAPPPEQPDTGPPHRCDSIAELLATRAAPAVTANGYDQALRPLQRSSRTWVNQTLEAIKSCAHFKRLPEATRTKFETLWAAFDRFNCDITTAKAAHALFGLHKDGRLATDNGKRLVENLARYIERDEQSQGIASPLLSDVVLALAKPRELTRTLDTGQLPHERARVQAAQVRSLAAQVARSTRSSVQSTNRAGAGFWTHVIPTLLGFDRLNNVVREVYGDGANVGHTPDLRVMGTQQLATLRNLALDQRIGNCDECQAITATHLHERGVVRVEAMSRPNSHAFVVVNRDPLSDPAQPSTWGADALVVESWGPKSGGQQVGRSTWSGEVFPASEVPTKLPGDGEIVSDLRLVDYL